MSALIGHTGFVGSNLRYLYNFDESFNSLNFRDMAGREFDLVVCAGLSAAKWLANRNPEEDREKIAALEKVLGSVRAQRFILISTVDVYPVLSGVDESFDCHSMDNHAYGCSRLAFEDFVRGHFEGAFIIRLPGLFGPGLKKNIIFDLINDNCLGMINPQSSFQWYDITNLWRDIQTVLDRGIRLVNIVNEPIKTEDILNRFFPDKTIAARASPAISYDIRTRHAGVFGGTGSYILGRESVLEQIGAFVKKTQAGDT